MRSETLTPDCWCLLRQLHFTRTFNGAPVSTPFFTLPAFFSLHLLFTSHLSFLSLLKTSDESNSDADITDKLRGRPGLNTYPADVPDSACAVCAVGLHFDKPFHQW